MQVHVGEYLIYTVGSLRYSSASDTINNSSTNNDDSTTYIIIISIVVILLIGIIIIVIISFCVIKWRSRKSPISFSGNPDVNMYASPAYGTHQVFSEPGMDHLYEPIDELYEEKSTTFQDATPAVNDDETDADGYLKVDGQVVTTETDADGYLKVDDQVVTTETDTDGYLKVDDPAETDADDQGVTAETDADGYFKMKSYSEGVDQEGSVGNTESHTVNDTTDEYVQAADDYLLADTTNEDDGYEKFNDDQKKKNESLQLKVDHEEDTDF